MRAILSLDIGGTKLAAAVLRPDGALIAARRGPCPASEGPAAVIEALVAIAAEASAEGGVRFDSAGVSVGGPLDAAKGIVFNPPNLPGWDRVPLRHRLAAGLGLPEERVAIENDANACALAEQRFGAARGRSHALYLTMSTGIGGGLILDGRLYRGATGNAGELGHQIVLPDGPLCGCGGRGCLEAFASGSGIARRLRDQWQVLPGAIRDAAGSADRVGPEHLFAAARLPDPWAARFLDETIDWLARGLANVIFILNPEVIILGTMAYHAGDLLLEPLRARVRAHCWPILCEGLEIVATPLGPRLEQLSGLSVALLAIPS